MVGLVLVGLAVALGIFIGSQLRDPRPPEGLPRAIAIPALLSWHARTDNRRSTPRQSSARSDPRWSRAGSASSLVNPGRCRDVMLVLVQHLE